ncbi:aldehyde dehydrogenase family protein [Stenotrophobium rhamnosiphilum]|uniref:Aldehyde dehydrogenase n=1 Tax=Stenotrophobium rhamnosiphilum TaxID=2029166 RepID=A0A2T5MGA9_9GAMM|nr:aldehyde dehydrogenase family protein [Stenotrophobium rhamnosiphilum]PTU31625.1 aldehyde dehydrogenase family protein [Stenotrophobium rhamnosiphilum]
MNTAVSYLPNANTASSDAEIRRVFDRQRETALRLRASSAEERIAKIKRLRDAVIAHTQAFYDAGDKDFKKPPAEVDLTEILPIIMEANDAVRHIRKWMKPKGVWPTPLMFGTKAYKQYEPKGRSLIISPWNYPVNLTFGPLVSAIAAGCTSILKPSEMTPHLTAVMVKIIKEIFPEDEIAIFEGEASVSTTLLSLPFDHIFFTGSPAIGKVVMAAASKHLTSVTLELGGKSPTIVDASADLKMAARNILWGKFTNNGQTCIAPDHVFVHESVKAEFVKNCQEILSNTYGTTGDAQKNSPYLSRVVNQRHTGRINALLQDAKQRGANVLFGGDVSETECFVAPTLIENIPADAKIQTEEIFGPILPIISYNKLDEVINAINDQPKPLALYIWSKTEANIQTVLQRTSAGGTCINHTVAHFLHGRLPFGGVNNSGIGSAHGHFGFMAFTHERAVLRTRIALAPMFFPPYTNTTKKIVAILKKTV